MADNSSDPELLLELETIHDRTKCNVLKKFESWSVDPQCDDFQKFFQKLEEYIEVLSSLKTFIENFKCDKNRHSKNDTR